MADFLISCCVNLCILLHVGHAPVQPIIATGDAHDSVAAVESMLWYSAGMLVPTG